MDSASRPPLLRQEKEGLFGGKEGLFGEKEVEVTFSCPQKSAMSFFCIIFAAGNGREGGRFWGPFLRRGFVVASSWVRRGFACGGGGMTRPQMGHFAGKPLFLPSKVLNYS